MSNEKQVAVSYLEKEIKRLRAEKAEIDDMLEVYEQAFKKLNRGQQQLFPSDDKTVNSKKYAALNNSREAVELFLEEHPDKYYKASEVRQCLKQLGFEPTAKQKTADIYHVLKRLTNKGTVERVQWEIKADNGKLNKVFHFKFKNNEASIGQQLQTEQ